MMNVVSFGKVRSPQFGEETFHILQGWDILYGEDGHYSDFYLYQIHHDNVSLFFGLSSFSGGQTYLLHGSKLGSCQA